MLHIMLKHYTLYNNKTMLFLLLFCFFETRLLQVSPAILQLTLQTRLVWNRDPPASALRALRPKACTTTADPKPGFSRRESIS